MAINKKIINFKKKAHFTSQSEGGNILPHSICFIDDTCEIVTHNTTFGGSKVESTKVSFTNGAEIYKPTTTTVSLQLTEQWINSTVAVPTEAGTYMVEVHTDKEYASGIFSVCGDTDVMFDEVTLHMSSNKTRRIYLKTNDSSTIKNFMLSTSTADSGAKNYTIRYKKVM